MFLFGIFYQLHPAIDRSRTALIQVSIWILGTLTLTLGVALIHSGHETGTPLAALGSVTVLAGMLLFGWLVVRREQERPSLRWRPARIELFTIPNGGGARSIAALQMILEIGERILPVFVIRRSHRLVVEINDPFILFGIDRRFPRQG